MLVDDVSVTHIISNGSWQNNTPHPAQEPGAPVVSNLTISTVGQPTTIGPFNMAGIFHYYCSVVSTVAIFERQRWTKAVSVALKPSGTPAFLPNSSVL
jgi:hypothetical protein